VSIDVDCEATAVFDNSEGEHVKALQLLERVLLSLDGMKQLLHSPRQPQKHGQDAQGPSEDVLMPPAYMSAEDEGVEVCKFQSNRLMVRTSNKTMM